MLDAVDLTKRKVLQPCAGCLCDYLLPNRLKLLTMGTVWTIELYKKMLLSPNRLL
jgi:hypothetical protein